MKKVTGKNKGTGMFPSIVVGAAVALVSCIIACMATPLLITNDIVAHESLQILAILVQMCCAFAGAYISGVMHKERMLLAAMGSLVIFVAVLLLCNLMFFGVIGKNAYVGLLCGFAGALVSVLVQTCLKRRGNRRVKRARSR